MTAPFFLGVVKSARWLRINMCKLNYIGDFACVTFKAMFGEQLRELNKFVCVHIFASRVQAVKGFELPRADL